MTIRMTSTRSALWRLLAVFAALSLVITACSGGDSDDDTSDTTVAGDDDGDGGGDEGESASAGPIEAGESFANGVRYSGVTTFEEGTVSYSGSLDGGSIVTIELVGADDAESGITVELKGSGTSLFRGSVNPGEEAEEVLVLGVDSGGPVEFVAVGQGGFEFEITEVSQDDGGLGTDAGDDLASSSDAETGTIEGVLGGTDPADFYTISLDAGQVVTVDFSNDAASSSRARAEIAFNGSRLDLVDVNPGGADGFTRVLAADGAGDYIFTVSGSGARVDYTLDITAADQTDGGLPGDAPAEASAAREIDAGEELEGRLGDADGGDVYTIDAPAGALVSVEVTNDATSDGRLRAMLFVNGERVALEDLNPGGTATLTHTGAGATAMPYVIEFTSGGGVLYTFTPTVGTQNDAGQPGDAPDDAASARAVDPGAEYQGVLGDADTEDFYSYDAPAATGQITFTNAADSEGRVRVEAFVDGDRIGLVDVNPGGTDTIELAGLITGGTVVIRMSTTRDASYSFTPA